MKLPAILIAALGLSACTATGLELLAPPAPPSALESRFLARGTGGAWADATPLAEIQASGSARCATTSKGAACLLPGDETGPGSNLATARAGRCLARWSGDGTGTTVAIVTLHRSAFPTERSPRYERLYYLLNSEELHDPASRLTDPAGFTRLCDQLLQPDILPTRIRD